MTIEQTSTLIDADSLLRSLHANGVEITRPVWEIKLIQQARSMLTFRVRSASHDLVVRRPALGHRTPSAQDIHREFKVIVALRAAGLPVPRPLAASLDASVLGTPFLVLQCVDGIALRTADDLYGLPNEALRTATTTLVATLAATHSIDITSVGLADLRRPKHDAACEVEHWRRQWDLVGQRDHALVDELTDRMIGRAPEAGRASVVHGDFWIGNAIIDRLTCSKIRAVVGWDLCGVGDPLSDVATLCAYQHPAINALLGVRAASTSPRMPSASRLMELYAAAADVDLVDWPFQLALAYFKLAVRAQQVATRFYDFEGPARSRPGEAVSLLLEAADRTVRAS